MTGGRARRLPAWLVAVLARAFVAFLVWQHWRAGRRPASSTAPGAGKPNGASSG